MNNIPIVHHHRCRHQHGNDSLIAPTPPSLCPSFADAPAASPEQSEIIDSVPIENLSIENETPANSNLMINDFENSPAPSLPWNKTSLKYSIKSSDLIFDSNEKLTEQHLCQCDQHEEFTDPSDLHLISEDHENNNNDNDNDEDDDDDDDNETSNPSKISLFCNRYVWSIFSSIQKYVAIFVGSKYFRRIVLSAIVINTLSMGIEYHGQPQSLTNALEYSNLVFTCLFAIEMVLKIIAEGCFKYIKSAYNLFDGAIVIMSVIELQGNKNSGLSVLRTFRLLRVLKLVRFMPTLRRQLVS